MKIPILILLSFICFVACKNKEADIIPQIEIVEHLTTEYYVPSSDFLSSDDYPKELIIRQEYYIYKNPPKDRNEIIETVIAHADSLKYFKESVELKKYLFFKRIYFMMDDTNFDLENITVEDILEDNVNNNICSFTMELTYPERGQKEYSILNFCDGQKIVWE